MKKSILFAALAFVGLGAFAQEEAKSPDFTVVKENPITSIKNQNQAISIAQNLVYLNSAQT